jgi:hypothetical protein
LHGCASVRQAFAVGRHSRRGFAKVRLEPDGKPLTVFRAELIGSEETGWEDLFTGFTALKAITFSSSIELLLRLSERLDDMEVVFGSESILSKEHLALAQRTAAANQGEPSWPRLGRT